MLFSCPVTRFISLACFYDQPFPLHPTHSVAFPHLISSPPISSFLFPSPYIQNPVCTRLYPPQPDPTQPTKTVSCSSSSIPHHLLHLLLPMIIFFSPSRRHRRPSPTTSSSSTPKNQPTRPPLQSLQRLLRRPSLFLFFAINSHCGSCESDAQGENGIEEPTASLQREKKILGELLLCCFVLGNVLWKMENVGNRAKKKKKNKKRQA